MAYLLDLRENMRSTTIIEDRIDPALAAEMSRKAWLLAEEEKPFKIPEETIKKVEVLDRAPGKKNPTFVVGPGGYGQFGLHERVKDVIESVEPDVHQFIEFQLVTPGGKPLEDRYYFLNIMQSFDALLVENSSVKWVWIDGSSSNEFRKKLVLRNPLPFHYVMSRAKIAGRHLWRGALMMDYEIFCSEVMFQAFKSAGLTRFFSCTPIKEIDEAWDHEENVGAYLRHRLQEREYWRERNERKKTFS